MNASSLDYCRGVARQARSSFPLAFRVLPPAKRDAMTALYAFFRLTDDLADEPGEPGQQRAALTTWRAQLDSALQGKLTHPVHSALVQAVEQFKIPTQYLHDVIDGVERDLDPQPFHTFPELRRYCYQVASAVGLACVHVWGFRGDVQDPAEAAGIAFQLTNILRDLGEDRSQGRVYLPTEDLIRFQSPPETWKAGDKAFTELMQFQVSRARQFYQQAETLTNFLTADGRAVYRVMLGVYGRLLDAIERRGYDVFRERVRVSASAKAYLILSAWPTRWGWL